MFLLEALRKGDGYAHLERWKRGTYVEVEGSDIGHQNLKIRRRSNKYKTVFNVSFKYLREPDFIPGKGVEKCESCKKADRLESYVYSGFMEKLLAEEIATHLRGSDHCKCEGN